jgi:propionyl-CoA carboxylase beta chain
MSSENPKIQHLRELREKARLAGGEARIAKHRQKGRLTARERLEKLLDPGSFQELLPFVAQRADPTITEEDTFLGDGVVAGSGRVDGRVVYVYAQDFTVMGGSLGEMQGQKISRVMDLAAQNGSPIIGLIDSGGARIQEGVYSLVGYAEIFRRNALYSGVVPQISIILGPCAGGAAYSPALTDFIIMVEKQSYMFITGPNVIKSVTGEEVDFEALGGARVHMSLSGLASLSAVREVDALAACRELLGYLPANNMENPPNAAPHDDPFRMDSELNSIVPDDPSLPYSMHAVIQHIVDQGSFLELQPAFAPNAIIGLARMDGSPVGIVSQEPSSLAGAIDINAADKICRFVRFCDCFNIPLVTFVDSPGFLPGVSQEHCGIIRHGAKVLYAYSEASVPKISLVTRKAYGGAYVVMSSKFLGTDINYAWPSAEIAVMGADGAANILYQKQIDDAADSQAERQRLVDEYTRKYLNPYIAARAGIIDEIIEPAETRPKIIGALASIREKQIHNPPRKHGNSPV